ncbi:MAG: hypothetical protein ORN20_06255, partial [Candidatus Nanopelagicales bacterium]|nr:hypothetical protein [Candidatus Nanopelagicales bacterium]
MSLEWTTLDGAGRPGLRYGAGTRDGRPLADLAEPLVDDATAADAVMTVLPGWLIATPHRSFATALTAREAAQQFGLLFPPDRGTALVKIVRHGLTLRQCVLRGQPRTFA